MTPAKEAAKAFYETLRAKGKRVDSAQLELAWERAAAAAIEEATWCVPCGSEMQCNNCGKSPEL